MLTKKYVKSRKICKVTFEFSESELPDAIDVRSVHLVGDFNDWDPAATPMKRGKKHIYRTTLELEPGREYQFRYWVNGEHWCNDWHADAYVPGPFGEDNSVVVTPAEATFT